MFQIISIIWWWLKDWLQNKPLGGLRDSGWFQFRKQYIKKHCECCGRKGVFLKPLQLHHCEPFHINSARELDPTNVVTLCNECHLRQGHLMSYKSWNINIKEDAAILLAKIKSRPAKEEKVNKVLPKR